MPKLENSNQPAKSVLKGEVHVVDRKLMHRVFEENIANQRSHDEVALIYEDESLPRRHTKYLKLNKTANQIAQAILERIEEGHAQVNQDGDWIIGVCMKPSDDRITVLLAVWKAGAAYLPIDVEYPMDRVTHVIKEANPALVIYDDSYPNANHFERDLDIKFSALKASSENKSDSNIPDESTLNKGDPCSIAVILYTSGSTGIPKGVRLSHYKINQRNQWQLRKYPFKPTEKHCAVKTSLTFVDHIGEIWCPLTSGRALIVLPKAIAKNPARLVPILEEFNVERFLCVPTLLQSILLYLNNLPSNKTKFMLMQLRTWFSSGEPLSNELAKEFFEYFESQRQTLVNFYGCTEISSDATAYEIQSMEQLSTLKNIPLGSPVDNMAIYVLDEKQQLLDEGVIGEIYCAGESVADGYIKGRDSKAFLKNPFESTGPYSRMHRMGDFGHIKNGLLYFKGRYDTQIKIRGIRIDVVEIERTINKLNYVAKSVILVHKAMLINQSLVAFIKTKPGMQKTPMEVEKDLKTLLPPYTIPQVLTLVEFPYLATGKLDRQRLLQMFEEIASRNTAAFVSNMNLTHVPRENVSMAKKVFDIIGNALGRELRCEISAKLNFFELGGNSLNAVYTVVQLSEKGYFIELTDFLEAENLGAALEKISFVKPGRLSDMNILSGMTLKREELDQVERDACVQLLANCFLKKSDIDHLLPNLTLLHYTEILNSIWDVLVQQGLSFKVKNEKGDLLGVSLNFDASEQPKIKTSNPWTTILDFWETIEKPLVKHQLQPSPGEVVHSFLFGTDESLNCKDNIGVTAFTENENIKLAKLKGFKGIFATNTNPLIQHFDIRVFGYENMAEVQVNKYVDQKGNRPFQRASDLQTAVVMYKKFEVEDDLE